MTRTRSRCVQTDKAKDMIPYGPSTRLRDLLRLRNNPTLFRNLKQQLYHIAEKHLAVEDIPRYQADGWAAIEDELLSTFPDIFDCEGAKTHLELVRQIISAHHHQKRFVFKQGLQSPAHSPRKHNFVMSVTVPTRAASKKEREAAKNRRENGVIDLTLDDGKNSVKNDVELVEPKLPLMTDISNRLPGPATLKRSPSPIKLNSSHIAGPSTPSPAALIKKQSTPLHAESSSQAQSANNASFMEGNLKQEDAFQLTGVTRVAGFLNACSPPMAHFLQRLIDFGCTSEEYLVAVSTWPTDKISHFLRQVVGRGSEEREFSQMDMLILQNHFISYFNKAQT